MTRRGRVAKPEWLAECRIESTFALYRIGNIPPAIQSFMLATTCKHALRGIYGGSNLYVAFCLLGEAMQGIFFAWRVRSGLLLKSEREGIAKIRHE